MLGHKLDFNCCANRPRDSFHKSSNIWFSVLMHGV